MNTPVQHMAKSIIPTATATFPSAEKIGAFVGKAVLAALGIAIGGAIGIIISFVAGFISIIC